MPIVQPSPAPVPGAVHATVCVGASDTAYTRAGRGAPVVLLTDAGESPLLGMLAEGFRVLVPSVPVRGEPFVAWLRGFMDGLGLEAACIVAAPALAADALRFAADEPASVRALVLLGAARPLVPPVVPMLLQPAGDADRTGAAIAPFLALHA